MVENEVKKTYDGIWLALPPSLPPYFRCNCCSFNSCQTYKSVSLISAYTDAWMSVCENRSLIICYWQSHEKFFAYKRHACSILWSTVNKCIFFSTKNHVRQKKRKTTKLGSAMGIWQHKEYKSERKKAKRNKIKWKTKCNRLFIFSNVAGVLYHV